MINNVTLAGRSIKDPGLRYTTSGAVIATFTLVVNRSSASRNGNQEVDSINCVTWRKLAGTMAALAKKDDLIDAVGRIQT